MLHYRSTIKATRENKEAKVKPAKVRLAPILQHKLCCLGQDAPSTMIKSRVIDSELLSTRLHTTNHCPPPPEERSNPSCD